MGLNPVFFSRFQAMAVDLQAAAPGETTAMAVDFTRGQILRAVVQSKTPIERVKEDGGIVGWVITPPIAASKPNMGNVPGRIGAALSFIVNRKRCGKSGKRIVWQ